MAIAAKSGLQQQIQTSLPNTGFGLSVWAKTQYSKNIGVPQLCCHNLGSFILPSGVDEDALLNVVKYNILATIYDATQLKKLSSQDVDTWNIGGPPKNIELILDELKSQLNVRDLQAVISEIRNATEEDTNDQLVKLLKDCSIPKINRWAILEFLTTERYPGLLPVILDHISLGQVDDFLDGCTIALRIVDINPDSREKVAKLMRAQSVITSPWDTNTTPLHRRIFGDTILVLASYGNEEDISLLLKYLSKDLNTGEFTAFLMKGLRMLLVRMADKVNPSVSFEIRTLAQKLLSIWADPLALNVEMSMFHRSVLVIKMLCARLDSADLEVVRNCAIASQDTSFIRLSLEAIQETERDLILVEMSNWLEKHVGYADKIKNDLKKYLAEKT